MSYLETGGLDALCYRTSWAAIFLAWMVSLVYFLVTWSSVMLFVIIY